MSLKLLIILFLIILNAVNSYKIFKLDELCETNQVNKIIKFFTNSKRTISLENDSFSAVIVEQSWNSSSFKRFRDCNFIIDSKSMRNRHRGIYASIRLLKLRKIPSEMDDCTDYIKFQFGSGQKTDEICGEFGTSSTHYQMQYFDDASGVIKVYIKIDNQLPLDDLDDTLEVSLVFTAYEDCKSIQQFMCIPGLERSCISINFKNDDVNNCPPPYCSDEDGRCTPVVKREETPKSTLALLAMTSLVFTMVAVIGCLWLCWKHYFSITCAIDSNRDAGGGGGGSATGSVNNNRTAGNSNRNDSNVHSRSATTANAATSTATTTSTTTTPSPTNFEIDDMPSIELRLPTDSLNIRQSTASQEHIEDKDLPPSYESLFADRH